MGILYSMTEQHKRHVVVGTIAMSLIPSVLILEPPSAPTLKHVALYLSALIGYWGIVLMLWMYLLGTKSVTALIFRDLAPVLRVHKWLGIYAIPMIFLHPLLVGLSYGANLLTFSILPSIATQYDRHVLLGQIALWLLVIIWVSSAILRSKLAFRPWKYIHYLAYVSIPFALLHVPDLGSQSTTHVFVRGYLFVLMLTFFAICILRLRSILNLDKSTYTVARHIQITKAGDYVLIARPADGSRPLRAPRRGQYVYIKLGFLSEDHPFSVTQYDEDTGQLTLAYRLAGMYTKELAKLQVGQSVHLSGPYGSFTDDLAETDTTPVVYLAGGIGITPFVDRVMSENDIREQWLFAANRSRETAVLLPQLKKELGDRCVAIYSAEQVPAANEEHGYITSTLLGKYLSDPTKYRYYLCGPPPMMQACREALAELGVPPSQVRSETFGW